MTIRCFVCDQDMAAGEHNSVRCVNPDCQMVGRRRNVFLAANLKQRDDEVFAAAQEDIA